MKILPVTRTWITGVVAVTLGVRFGLLNLGHLLFFPELVLFKLHVWRLVTPFLWLGKLELSWLINLFMMCVALAALLAALPTSLRLTLSCTRARTLHLTPLWGLAAGASARTMRGTATPRLAARAAAA